MPFLDQGDWTLDQLVTTAKLNQMRDNWLALKQLGDYGAAVYGAATSVPSGTPTRITTGGTMWDYGSMVSGSSLVIPAGGVYVMHAVVTISAHATGYRMLHLRKNGESTSVVSGQLRESAKRCVDDSGTTGRETVLNFYHEDELNVGDTFELYVTQDSGSTLTVQGGREHTRWGIRYVGPKVSTGALTVPLWQASFPWAGRAVSPSSFNTWVRDRQRFLYNHRGSYYRATMHSQDQVTRQNSKTVIELNEGEALGDALGDIPARSLTIDKDGRWRLWVATDWQDITAGSRYHRVDVDGEYDFDVESHQSPSGDIHSYRSWYIERTFKAGQRITPTLDQDSGQDIGINSYAFGGGWLGPIESAPVWVAPRTWVASEDVTLPALFDAELNDKGDNLLKLDNAYCELKLAGNVSVSHDNPVRLSWSSAAVNLGGMWSSDTPYRVSIPITGKYRIVGTARWQSENSGHRQVFYRKNGGATDYELESKAAITVNDVSTVNNWYAEEAFDAGDYVEFYVRHTRGASWLLFASDTYAVVALIGT